MIPLLDICNCILVIKNALYENEIFVIEIYPII